MTLHEQALAALDRLEELASAAEFERHRGDQMPVHTAAGDANTVRRIMKQLRDAVLTGQQPVV